MLIVTGLMVAWVLVVMVGTHRPDHAEGRLAARHADRGPALPYWSGLWFGIFPTWQGDRPAGARADVFVLGSYVAAEGQRRRRRNAAVIGAPAVVPAAGAAVPDPEVPPLDPEPAPARAADTARTLVR